MSAASPIKPQSGALQGLRVVDFTTLLPGPLCTRMLAACGADVVKVERPGPGDEMRRVAPLHAGRSLPYELLNAGKRSVTLDLKQPEGLCAAMALIRKADILVEQFRPGVMARLGLDYETLRAECPKLIYCSITGYGQDGPQALVAGHDLNYAAHTGLLTLTTPSGTLPGLPPVPLADLAGGTYPALVNILLALRRRECGEGGIHLDINMSAGLVPLMYGAFAAAQAPAFEDARLYSGGSPRYRVYDTSDGRFLAVAAVEEHFWTRFCTLAQIPVQSDAETVASAVRRRSASEWAMRLAAEDVCCTLVALSRDYFNGADCPDDGGRVAWGPNGEVKGLPLPLHPAFRAASS